MSTDAWSSFDQVVLTPRIHAHHTPKNKNKAFTALCSKDSLHRKMKNWAFTTVAASPFTSLTSLQEL
jgi:hypothetical protein